MQTILSVQDLSKTYKGGHSALKNISFEIKEGEIFALLGPNGAGKTTLISVICGIATPSKGRVTVGGHDIISDYKKARSLIGLVPQELTTDAFETVWNTVTFSRGIFDRPANPGYVESVLKANFLWDKRNSKIYTLSGGMKRRALIAKALAHEPRVLFLDEPTAGVDVELRKSMWQQVHALRKQGVTIVLTTHYLEEAEEMADRIGIINRGEIVLIDEKKSLMKKLGKKQLRLDLKESLSAIPTSLSAYGLELMEGGNQLVYTYETIKEANGVGDLLDQVSRQNIAVKDIHTKQSSLEEIFVGLLKS